MKSFGQVMSDERTGYRQACLRCVVEALLTRDMSLEELLAVTKCTRFTVCRCLTVLKENDFMLERKTATEYRATDLLRKDFGIAKNDKGNVV